MSGFVEGDSAFSYVTVRAADSQLGRKLCLEIDYSEYPTVQLSSEGWLTIQQW